MVWWTLACVTLREPLLMVGAPPPPIYAVDPNFTGDAGIEGANVEYYEIAGKDDLELLGQIRTLGPRLSDGVRAATTRAEVAWEVSGDGVSCLEVRVFPTITVIFPRWTPPPGAPPSSLGNWQRFVYALARHEQGHVDIIAAGVATMPGRLAGDCAGVDARGRLVLAEIDAAGADYDAATEVGATQGAVLFAPRR
ncbi:hypothetical protein LBMAG42_53980 [Deltaproteobacteria bacterium]|nr:hypothetical protein LBMAG42_53980 [Deltaproteobacteria bacterium]